MFQSLNATGTPLTALETFKPLVVSLLPQITEDLKAQNLKSISSKWINLVERV